MAIVNPPSTQQIGAVVQSVSACQPSPPAPQRRDVGPAYNPQRFAHEAADPRPIRQLHLADAQRRRDAVDEAAGVFGGQLHDIRAEGRVRTHMPATRLSALRK